jgi:hypothetical protein
LQLCHYFPRQIFDAQDVLDLVAALLCLLDAEYRPVLVDKLVATVLALLVAALDPSHACNQVDLQKDVVALVLL